MSFPHLFSLPGWALSSSHSSTYMSLVPRAYMYARLMLLNINTLGWFPVTVADASAMPHVHMCLSPLLRSTHFTLMGGLLVFSKHSSMGLHSYTFIFLYHFISSARAKAVRFPLRCVSTACVTGSKGLKVCLCVYLGDVCLAVCICSRAHTFVQRGEQAVVWASAQPTAHHGTCSGTPDESEELDLGRI